MVCSCSLFRESHKYSHNILHTSLQEPRHYYVQLKMFSTLFRQNRKVFEMSLVIFCIVVNMMVVEGVSKPPLVCARKWSSLFGNQKTTTFSIKGSIPSDYRNSYVCQLPTISPASFVSMQSNQDQKGYLHAIVYDAKLKAVTHLDSTNTNITSERSFGCMSAAKDAPKFLMVSGTPDLTFTMTVSFIHKPLKVNDDGNITYMTFNNSKLLHILPNPTSRDDAQLDITVKSDSKGEGVLKVSNYCEQATKFGEIHNEKPALSLTFEHQGRITISKVSRPKFSASEPLYVFVNIAEPKTYSVEFKMSFRYDYLPILYITLLSIGGGLLIAIFAFFTFYYKFKPFKDVSPGIDNTDQPHKMSNFQAMKMLFKYWMHVNELRPFSYTTLIVGCVFVVGGLQFAHLSWETMIENGNRDRCFYNDMCYRVSHWHDLPFNLMMSNIPYLVHGLMLALALLAMELHFIHKAKTKAKTKASMGAGLPAQNQDVLPCHALECPDLNLHLPELTMPSFNCGRDRLVELYTYSYKRKYNFSIGYAFAWALVFEGVFSTIYHLCPSRATFQLDTAFMFVICGMIIISLFNGLSDVSGSHDKRPIGNNKFFLAVVVPLYLFNYLGFVYNEFTTNSSFDAFFFIFLAAWFIAMVVWSFRKLDIVKSFKCEDCKLNSFKVIVFLIAVVVNVIILVRERNDFSQAFLFSCIFSAIFALFAKCIINTCITCCCPQQQQVCNSNTTAVGLRPLRGKDRQLGRVTSKNAKPATSKTATPSPRKQQQRQQQPQQQQHPRQQQGSTRKILAVRFIYYIILLLLVCSAVYVFSEYATTQKTDTPAQSRNRNKECVWLEFFDWHDVWHLLSSFALLMAVFPLMFCNI